MANPEAELPEVCRLLNRHNVDYLLVGGMAVSFHGYARATADIDFWFAPTTENYFKLLKALNDFEVDTSELNEHVFDPKNTFIRIKSGGVKIEFLSDIPGTFNYREAEKASVKTDIDGVVVKVISLEHLIENKTALNRPVDRLDVEELKKRKKPRE